MKTRLLTGQLPVIRTIFPFQNPSRPRRLASRAPFPTDSGREGRKCRWLSLNYAVPQYCGPPPCEFSREGRGWVFLQISQITAKLGSVNSLSEAPAPDGPVPNSQFLTRQSQSQKIFNKHEKISGKKMQKKLIRY